MALAPALDLTTLFQVILCTKNGLCSHFNNNNMLVKGGGGGELCTSALHLICPHNTRTQCCQ